MEFAAYYIFWDPDALLVWARATSVAFAAATVAFVGVLARRLYGSCLALAAAAFIAVDVVHVRQASLASVVARGGGGGGGDPLPSTPLVLIPSDAAPPRAPPHSYHHQVAYSIYMRLASYMGLASYMRLP